MEYINIDNSMSKIATKNQNILTILNNILSYKVKDSFFLRKELLKKYEMGLIYRNLDYTSFLRKIEELMYVRFFNKNDNSFPTGLLNIVTSYFEKNNILFELKDLRRTPSIRKIYRKIKQPFPLRYYQKEIVNACLSNPRGIIEAATGSGKTNCIVELIYQLKNNVLIIVPSSTIISQTSKILINVFGKKHIGIITGNKKEFDKPITIATYQSLGNIDESFFKKLDTLIIDEAHHSGCNSLVSLNNLFNSCYYRYFFTGTAYRNDGKDMDLQSVITDQFIYKYPIQKGIEDKYLCPIKFVIYKYQHPYPIGKWREELDTYIINNEKYNNFIIDKANKLNDKKIATIIFVDQINHGKFLESKIPNSVFVNGTEEKTINMEAIEDFNKGKFHIMIGTSVIGEGVDTVKAQCGILAGGGKAKSTLVQRIGRLLRPCQEKNMAYIMDFTHSGTKYLQNHYIERLVTYKQFGEQNIKFKDFV